MLLDIGRGLLLEEGPGKVSETSQAAPGKIVECACPGPLFLCYALLILYKGQVVGQDPPGKCNKLHGFACRKKQDPLKSDWIPLGSPVDPLWIPHGSPLRNRLLEHMHMLIF